MTHTCPKCRQPKPLDSKHFQPYGDGTFRAVCRDCRNAGRAASRAGKAAPAPAAPRRASDDFDIDEEVPEDVAAAIAKQEADRATREASDYDPLKFGDFEDDDRGAGVARGERDPNADREKKQEYARNMGRFADALRTGGTTPELASYIARLSEEERRFGNRRIARSISLRAAHEALHLRQVEQMARAHLSDRVVPIGYAQRPPVLGMKRAVVTLWSDWHIRSDLLKADNPEVYGAEEESRAVSRVVQEVADYKIEHRSDSRLIILLNGDILEGKLGHDDFSGAPLPEQKVAAWSYLRLAIGYLSQAYKHVHVECQAGNHGRDIHRHPGRATSSKWQGHEWELYVGLKFMCSGLQNVTWGIPLMAISDVELPGGHHLLQSHGDTEIKIRDPDSGASENAKSLAMVNATRIYGREFAVAVFGHYHKGREFWFRAMRAVFGPALVPPNGHARTEGYINERRGQFVWEAVEGYPVGDKRMIEVGANTDHDAKLNELIPPFRIPDMRHSA